MSCQIWTALELECTHRADSSIASMLNPYEQARLDRIADNDRRLAQLGIRKQAAIVEAAFSKQPASRKTRAPKVKGRAPIRKSDRNVRQSHCSLSEEVLSGGPEVKKFTFAPCRRRFNSETMPRRKAPEHEFDEKYTFADDKSKANARVWYGHLVKQPDLKEHPETCEQIAFNMAEEWVYPESIRGVNDDKISRSTRVAFTDMAPKLGPEVAVENLLEQLQQGPLVADEASERRHGPGRKATHNSFNDWLAAMVRLHKDDALQGMEFFVKVSAREEEVAKVLNDTWALVKDEPDAMKLYGTNPCKGRGFNSDFRKVLSRKFGELAKKKEAAGKKRKLADINGKAPTTPGAGDVENDDPNLSDADATSGS